MQEKVPGEIYAIGFDRLKVRLVSATDNVSPVFPTSNQLSLRANNAVV
jgi:hypothetical protein